MTSKQIHNIDIQNRNLTLEEAQKLSQAIRETPNITYYSVKELVAFKKVFVAKIANELSGVGILDRVNKDWWELKIVFVFEPYRGKGIGLSLTQKGIDFLEEKKANIFAISRNPVTIKWLKDNNFCAINSWQKLPRLLKFRIIKSSFHISRIFEYIRKSVKYGSNKDWLYFVKYTK